MRIRWTRRAARDLDGIETYIEDDDPQAAARMALRIFDAVEHLAQYPHLGRRGRIPGTRELVVPGTAYIVPYRAGPDALEILRVIHAAMRWPDDF